MVEYMRRIYLRYISRFEGIVQTQPSNVRVRPNALNSCEVFDVGHFHIRHLQVLSKISSEKITTAFMLQNLLSIDTESDLEGLEDWKQNLQKSEMKQPYRLLHQSRWSGIGG